MRKGRKLKMKTERKREWSKREIGRRRKNILLFHRRIVVFRETVFSEILTFSSMYFREWPSSLGHIKLLHNIICIENMMIRWMFHSRSSPVITFWSIFIALSVVKQVNSHLQSRSHFDLLAQVGNCGLLGNPCYTPRHFAILLRISL
jgi:hypothetical protein